MKYAALWHCLFMWPLFFFPHLFRLCKLKLKSFNVTELIEITDKNEQCRAAAEDVFKTNYHQHTFLICGKLSADTSETIEKEWGIVRIVDAQLAEILLNRFGHLIEVIIVDFEEMDVNDGKNIVKLIVQKCSAFLKSIRLKNCRANVLDELNSAFPNVTLMRFSSSLTHNFRIRPDLKFNEIFPNVNNLYLEQTKTSDWSFFDGNLPNLNIFALDVPKSQGDGLNDESIVIKFFKQNRQIKVQVIDGGNLKILKQLSEIHPTLNLLQLFALSEDCSNNQGDPVKFTTIKEVYVVSHNADEIPRNLYFDQLYQFTLHIHPNDFTDKWAQYINKQVNLDLNNLYLNVGELSFEQLLSISKMKPNLRNVAVRCSSNFLADDLVEFLKTNHFLNVLDMNNQMTELEQNHLKEILPKQWNIEKQMKNGPYVYLRFTK